MLSKLKKKIKNFVDHRINLLKDQQRLNEQIHFDYNQISQLFKEDNFIPYTGWSVSPSLILHVLNDICIHKRKAIIEFGSGASTFYICKLLKSLERDIIFYSVESNDSWYKEMKDKLIDYGLADHVILIYAPITPVSEEISYKFQENWYDAKILKDKIIKPKKFDLVLVDGPLGGSTPYARFSAIPFLKDQLTENCNVYLDDTNRPEEREIAEKWARDNSFNLTKFNRYSQLKRSSKFDELPYQLENLRLK